MVRHCIFKYAILEFFSVAWFAFIEDSCAICPCPPVIIVKSTTIQKSWEAFYRVLLMSAG